MHEALQLYYDHCSRPSGQDTRTQSKVFIREKQSANTDYIQIKTNVFILGSTAAAGACFI